MNLSALATHAYTHHFFSNSAFRRIERYTCIVHTYAASNSTFILVSENVLYVQHKKIRYLLCCDLVSMFANLGDAGQWSYY